MRSGRDDGAERGTKCQAGTELDVWQPKQAPEDVGSGVVAGHEQHPTAAAHAQRAPGSGELFGQNAHRAAPAETDQRRRLVDLQVKSLPLGTKSPTAAVEHDLHVGVDVEHGRATGPSPRCGSGRFRLAAR